MVFTTKDPPSILKNVHLLSLVLFILSHLDVTAQEHMSSGKAYENYQQLSAAMAKSFPEDAIKTYRRTSYTEHQLEGYLSQHFQRLDLLPLIKDKPDFVIDAYLHSGNWLRAIGLIKESVDSYIMNPISMN